MMRLILMLCLLALPLRAEEIVSGLSQTRVSINASFDGTSILIYGAATREEKPPVWPLLQVIITVEGPVVPIVVRQKERVAGERQRRQTAAKAELGQHDPPVPTESTLP